MTNVAAIGALLAKEKESGFADISVPAWAWFATLGLIVVLLMLDILVLHRTPKVLKSKRAALETLMWVAVGVSFGVAVVIGFGGKAGGEYFSGYLIEYSLSIDNVFVWALIFTFFAVPALYQHRVLFWGIFGALVLRAIFIFAGVALISKFDWILYIFGAFLIYTAIKLLRGQDEEMNPEENFAFRLVKKVVPSTPEMDGQKLFTKVNAKRLATPLFAVLVLVETTDVLFAVDSVPAVLAVSREQFIVFTSNAFAILGLRALYFLLAQLHAKFTYLQQGLAVILAFVGIKMIIHRWFEISGPLSLIVIGVVLAAAVVASLKFGPPGDSDDDIDLVELPPTA
ncbi:MAG: putative TerC family integral rane protein [Ilumatobacteraceae bacterium]|nr:putative TerC family integral rane protein [Ilumatobacteraceae bacterium]